MSAARVIAAGSVMNEPRRGTKASATNVKPNTPDIGMNAAIARTSAIASCRIGRLPATTMIAKTKRGSVKFRDSR